MRWEPARVALAAAAAVVTLTSPRPAGQQLTFSSGVEAVRVDALVKDGARVVPGLGPADFQIRDNGVPQTVDLVLFEQVPLYVVLVLDASESVVGERLEQLRAAGLAAIGGLVDRDQAAMLTFNQSVSLVSGRTTDLRTLRTALQQIRPGGGTALYDAMHAGIVVGNSNDARTLILVFTDGADTSSFLTKEAVLDTARRSDAVIYAALEGTRTLFLEQLTGETGGSLSLVSSTKDLPGLFARMLDEFRHRYLLGYTPTGVTKGGWHRIEVGVKGRSYSVKARAGYQVGR
jgi:Ca-activated chloride channel family protein